MWYPSGIAQRIRENESSPYCVTVYDVNERRRALLPVKQEADFVRVNYRNYNTGRLNLTYRFRNPTHRDAVLDEIDSLGIKFRVHDDKRTGR